MYKIFTIKRYFEQFIMFPFVLIGKLIALIQPLSDEYDVFFFFPGYSVGGAERVNAEILRTIPDKKCILFFTKNSPNDGMRHFFDLPNVTIKSINRWTDNKWIFWVNLIYRGICSAYINQQTKKPVVFIGQCNFAYKLTPHINRTIKIVELIHMHDPRFAWVWAPFVRFIDTRVTIGKLMEKQFANFYSENNIPSKYLNRFTVIYNRLEYLPDSFHSRTYNLPLRVYYAGRGGEQKRVWLLVAIIKKCREMKLPLEFKLAGSFANELPNDLIKDGTYVGEIAGGNDMYTFHKQNDILLMTSAWEGFPMVIMEAMALGVIPVVTNVDGIPEHIQSGVNGFLINEIKDEDQLIDEAIQHLNHLIHTRNELNPISKNAYHYALQHFGARSFTENYRKVMGF
jgi:glycosyltransferase involved in cell wall biosynthesis